MSEEKQAGLLKGKATETVLVGAIILSIILSQLGIADVSAEIEKACLTHEQVTELIAEAKGEVVEPAEEDEDVVE